MATLNSPNAVEAHELKDGEVIRSLELILRDHVLYARYAIGMNDDTLAKSYAAITDKQASAEVATLTDKFAEIIGAEVAANTQIFLGDEQIKVTENTVRRTPVHHERFVVEFKIPLKKVAQATDFKIVDKNFSGTDGQIRYALRPRGTAIVTKSNVAPVLARAKPITISNLTDDKRPSAQIITARIKFLPKK
jgi:hypothetical protein